jgi:hypothetical protein
MTDALDNFNACVAALHLTCQIANEYYVGLWHFAENQTNSSDVDLNGDNYACELEDASSSIPFECQIKIRSNRLLEKIVPDVYAVQLQTQFMFIKEAHDYFLKDSASEIFEGSIDQISASYVAPTVLLRGFDYALIMSQKADLKKFKVDGYYESYIRKAALDRHFEFKALLPWLEHFWTCLSDAVGTTQFNVLVKQLQVILRQIDRIHEYEFASYQVLLGIAGDFSPLLNNLNNPPKV